MDIYGFGNPRSSLSKKFEGFLEPNDPLFLLFLMEISLDHQHFNNRCKSVECIPVGYWGIPVHLLRLLLLLLLLHFLTSWSTSSVACSALSCRSRSFIFRWALFTHCFFHSCCTSAVSFNCSLMIPVCRVEWNE